LARRMDARTGTGILNITNITKYHTSITKYLSRIRLQKKS
jgi:hypothetical protein